MEEDEKNEDTNAQRAGKLEEDEKNDEEMDKEMDDEMIVEEEPFLSDFSSPEHQVFSDTGTDTTDAETETECEDEKTEKFPVCHTPHETARKN